MKKILLTITTLFSLAAVSQTSIQLKNTDNNVILNPNDIIYLNVSASDNVKATLDVKNTSGSTKTYNVKRYDVLLNTGAVAYFCFAGSCYGDQTFESPSPLTLDSLQSASEIQGTFNMLTADLDEGPTAGQSTVKYTFINTANSADSIQITIKYNTTPPTTTGIKETKSSSSFDIFPNPAKDAAVIRINVTKSFPTNLIVYNALGNVVYQKDVYVTEGKNQIELPLENLPAGLYFTTIKLEGSSLSKRLIVK